jgi:prepilin-type N-terminal cleavage/methylation domain-containing protein
MTSLIPRRLRRICGFTLVELLIALSIFSIVAVGISSVFRSGLRTWRAGNQWSEENQGARNFFRIISKELQNSMNGSPEISFEGSAHEVSFLTLVDAYDPVVGSIRSLARVVYRHDAKKKTVKRIIAGLEAGFDIRKAKEVVVAENVSALDFTYAFAPIYENESIRWKSAWKDSKEIPRGIRIRMDGFRTSVFLPMGVLGDERALQ